MPKTSFDHLWELLAPTGEFVYRERACRRLWDTFDLDKQHEIYRRIRDKLRHGEFINPNPYFAIVNNVDDGAPTAEPPTNYYGSRGLYTEQDVLKHHLTTPELFVQT